MRSLCRSDSKDGGIKTTDTIVAEVVLDGANANRAAKNGRAEVF